MTQTAQEPAPVEAVRLETAQEVQPVLADMAEQITERKREIMPALDMAKVKTLPTWAQEYIGFAQSAVGDAPLMLESCIYQCQDILRKLGAAHDKYDNAVASLIEAQVELSKVRADVVNEIGRLQYNYKWLKEHRSSWREAVQNGGLPEDPDPAPVDEAPGAGLGVAIPGTPEAENVQLEWQPKQTARMLCAKYFTNALINWPGIDSEARKGVDSGLIDDDSRVWLLERRDAAKAEKSTEEVEQYNAMLARAKAARLAKQGGK